MRSIARVPTVQRSKRPSLQLSSMWSASATRVLCGWTVVSAPDTHTHTECVASHTCCTLVSLPTCCYSVEAQSCPNPRKRGRGARLACSLFKEREQSHRTALKSFGSCTKCKGSTSPNSAKECGAQTLEHAGTAEPRGSTLRVVRTVAGVLSSASLCLHLLIRLAVALWPGAAGTG